MAFFSHGNREFIFCTAFSLSHFYVFLNKIYCGKLSKSTFLYYMYPFRNTLNIPFKMQGIIDDGPLFRKIMQWGGNAAMTWTNQNQAFNNPVVQIYIIYLIHINQMAILLRVVTFGYCLALFQDFCLWNQKHAYSLLSWLLMVDNGMFPTVL